MEGRRLYDRAIFWLGLGGAVAAVGGIILGIGVAQTKPNVSLWSNAWFDCGLGGVILGVGLLGWALILFMSHARSGARFEVVSAEWECDPPLSDSPVHDPRSCTAHVVLRNKGHEGNGVLIVHYVGFGRAGNEFPSMERRTVIPATAAGAFVEVRSSVGSVPPLKLEHPPRIEVMPAALLPRSKMNQSQKESVASPSHIARPWALAKAAEEAAQRPQVVVVSRPGNQVVLANHGPRPALNCIYLSRSEEEPGWGDGHTQSRAEYPAASCARWSSGASDIGVAVRGGTGTDARAGAVRRRQGLRVPFPCA